MESEGEQYTYTYGIEKAASATGITARQPAEDRLCAHSLSRSWLEQLGRFVALRFYLISSKFNRNRKDAKRGGWARPQITECV